MAATGKVHNKIGHNLTGGQIQTLTTFLLLVQGIRPLYVLTTYLDALPYDVLNATILYPRRKLSGVSQEELVNGLCEMLATQKRSQAWELFVKLKVERTSIIRRIAQFLKDYDESGYEEAYQRYLFNPDDAEALEVIEWVEARMGCQPFTLWQVYHHVKAHTEVFFEFRSAIVEQFMYLAQKSAGYYYQNRTRSISFDDLLQNVLASITKALDRYDSNKGALTSYINFWLINSQAQDKHAEGLAYDVPNSTKVGMAAGRTSQVNFAISLSKTLGEDLTLEDTLVSHFPNPEQQYDQQQQEAILLRIIKCADVGGMFRLVNGVKETFLEAEQDLMRRHMEEHSLLETTNG